MRKGMFLLLALFLLVVTLRVSGQQLSVITVKSHDLNNHVVLIEVVKADKAYELNCNEGMPACTSLKNGKYVMLELPKNRGMYECRNVEVYPEGTSDPESAEKIGSYCLEPK